MKQTRDYSYRMTTRCTDGTIHQVNTTDTRKGYKQSFFLTEEAVRARVEQNIKFYESYGDEILSWEIYNVKTGTIDSYAAPEENPGPEEEPEETTLKQLAPILRSSHGSVQFAILYQQAKRQDLENGCSIDYLINKYPNVKVKRIEAFENQLIITI